MQQLVWVGAAFVSLLCADQASKALLLRRLSAREGDRRSIGGCMRLHGVVNVDWMPGVRVGTGGSALLLTLACLGALVLVSMSGSSVRTASVGIGLAAGGATGNLVDWVVRRGVVDFVDLRYWPVFNIADVAIVVGVSLLALAVIS